MSLLGVGVSLFVVLLLYIFIGLFPLYVAVKALGGKVTLLRVFLANVLVALLSFIFELLLNPILGVFSIILTPIAIIIVYRGMFNIGFIRALLAAFLAGVILALIVLGVGLIGLSL